MPVATRWVPVPAAVELVAELELLAARTTQRCCRHQKRSNMNAALDPVIPGHASSTSTSGATNPRPASAPRSFGVAAMAIRTIALAPRPSASTIALADHVSELLLSVRSLSAIKSMLSLSLLLSSLSADTLPPFLQSTTREPSTTESSLASYTPSPAQLPAGYGGAGGGAGGGGYGGGGYGSGTTPVPIEQRGPELTFAETGQDKTFVFAKNNTFIQMDGDIIQTFQLR